MRSEHETPEVEDVGGDTVIKKRKTDISIYEISIYLSDSIMEIDKYSEVIDTLLHAGQHDKVTMYLANFGGSCHSVIYLINSLGMCKAPVQMEVLAPCHSAGATLAISGDGLAIHKNTFLMFHNYSSVIVGKGAELKMSLDETDRWIKTYFEDLHFPFLTKNELKIISKDEDIYIHADDKGLLKRIERHYKVKLEKQS